mmetsp:Transcript_20333/g.30064  ORF Transcript_20333/g.30064 Transcript_20333/m.30064 type:complete len:506 (-) Transcript_20333:205-1722(-)
MEVPKEVVFHLTGFGKFNGVPDNPTSLLMKSLPVYLSQQKQQLGLILRVASYTVLEVSADGSSDQLRVIQNSGSNASLEGITVYVHFGVNVESTCFAIEECAYNEATFRVPDEKGSTPNAVPIISQNGPITHSYKSTLPTNWIYETLKTAGWGDCIETSQDPGRFVCNYLYYKSLAFCAESADKRSIFFHCPPLSVVCAEDQLCFVKDALIVIADSLVKCIQRKPQLAKAPSISERDSTIMALMTMGFDINVVNSVMDSTASADLDVNYNALVKLSEQQSNIDAWVKLPLPPMIPRTSSGVDSPFGNGSASSNQNSAPHMNLNSPGVGGQPYLPQATALPYNMVSPLSCSSLPMAIIQQHNGERRNSSGSLPDVMNGDGYNDESKSNKRMGQASKLLLIIRNDLELKASEITQQCVQASVRASRALNEYDSMAVRQWIRDGDQVMVMLVSSEEELENIVQNGSDLCLPVLTMLSNDEENNPVSIAAIGPAPSGVLDEISTGLMKY